MPLELRCFNAAAERDEAEYVAFSIGDGGASQPWETKCEESAA